MSVEAMSWALDCQLVSGTDKLVLLGIANHADRHGGNAWPSIDTLAHYATVKRRAAQNAVAHLTELGIVRVTINGGGDRRTPADRRPNLYEMVGMHADAPRGMHAHTPRGVHGRTERGARSRRDGVHDGAPEPSGNRPRTDPSTSLRAPRRDVGEITSNLFQRIGDET